MSDSSVEVTPQKRRMTIARGLTRIKTISAQIENIKRDLTSYSAWNNKKLCPASKSKDLAKNQQETAAYVKAQFQSFQDLCKELTNIKLAIQIANENTMITVAGKTISLAEALVIRGTTGNFYRDAAGCCSRSVLNAQIDSDKYNSNLDKIEDPKAREAMQSDVNYFVSIEEINELREFSTVFLRDIDGILNEANALTEIVLD